MRRIGRCMAVTAVVVMVASAHTHAMTVLDTIPLWNGSSNVATGFGDGNGTATLGQTFTPTATMTTLNSFSFWVNDDASNPEPVNFAAYIMEWNAGTSRATGAILYESSMVSTSNNGGAGGQEEFMFNTGALSLTAGTQYVAFLSTSKFFDSTEATAAVGGNSTSSYDGGQFVFLRNQSDPNLDGVTTQAWTLGLGETKFVANFAATTNANAVPEPITASLGLMGLAGLGYATKRRRGA